MPRFVRVLFIALGLVVGLACLLLIAANLYVQSKGTQARIQQELSQRVGADVKIQRISVTPWGGLTFSGLTIPAVLPNQSKSFLEVRTFRVRVELRSLFSPRIMVKDVSLSQAEVVWPQNKEGKWRLPIAVAAETAEAAPAVSPPSGPPFSPGLPVNPGRNKPTGGKREQQPLQAGASPSVRHINVKNGDFQFLDRKGTLVARFENVNFRSSVSDGAVLDGKALIEKAALHDRFFLSNLQTPVHYTPEQLLLSKLSAHAAGGDVEGAFSLQPQTQDAPYELSFHFRNLNADELVAKAGGPSGTIQGRLEGSFTARGASANAKLLSGSGDIFLRDGQLRQYSLLVALGQILQIEELTQLHLDQAEAKYHVDNGLIMVDQLVLRSPNIRLSATGTIAFDGKLQLDAQLAINDKVRSQLFKPIRVNFQALSETGLWGVDFQVSGTLARPKSNLVEKVVGRDLKDLGSVINSLLGGSKGKKKKREAEPAETAPADTAQPTLSATP